MRVYTVPVGPQRPFRILDHPKFEFGVLLLGSVYEVGAPDLGSRIKKERMKRNRKRLLCKTKRCSKIISYLPMLLLSSFFRHNELALLLYLSYVIFAKKKNLIF